MAEQNKKRDLTADEDRERIGGGPGASDASSGGGAGSGVPDAETNMRTDGSVAGGDVEEDRKKIFPEAKSKADRRDRE